MAHINEEQSRLSSPPDCKNSRTLVVCAAFASAAVGVILVSRNVSLPGRELNLCCGKEYPAPIHWTLYSNVEVQNANPEDDTSGSLPSGRIF